MLLKRLFQTPESYQDVAAQSIFATVLFALMAYFLTFIGWFLAFIGVLAVLVGGVLAVRNTNDKAE